MFDSPAPYVYV